MWKRLIVTTFLLILFILVVVYGINYSLTEWEQKFLEKKAEGPPTLQKIQSTIQSWLPTLTAWSIVASTLTVASLIAYRLYIAGARLLGVVKPRDFVKHLLLFGPTGSGKTSTAFRASELALKRGAEIVIVDWKGEYSDYFSGATIIRRLDILKPDTDYETYALVLSDIFRDVLELSDPMTFMLYDELARSYRVHGGKLTFAKLIRSLEARRLIAVQSRSFAEANIAEALIRRLYLLALDEKRPSTNTVGSNVVTIYDLSPLPTYQLKCVYAQTVLWRLYNGARASGRPLRKPKLARLLILEEAQNYVRYRRPERIPNIGERIFNELRAYGCGSLIVAPDPMQIPLHMVRDCGAIVSIGYQALPEVVSELLSFYRYADIKRLIKTTGRTRTYIYYNGKLYVKGVPKPFRKTIELGVPTREGKIEFLEKVKGEEVRKPIVKAELRLEEEEVVEEKPAVEKRPIEAVKEEAKPIEEAVEEVEGPGSSRVDPTGGIPA